MSGRIATLKDAPARNGNGSHAAVSSRRPRNGNDSATKSAGSAQDRLEAAQRMAMIENAPVNVILADRDLNIVYLNASSLATLQKIAKYLPVPVDRVLGSNVDVFHRDPAYQRRILSDPKNLPHRADIQIGPETANLLVSAIRDEDGAYIGPMVTWELVTETRRLEQEQGRLRSIVENIPINVMLADLNLNIVYVNPASRSTLEKLAKYLPIPVDKVVGSSVDVFHKNPAHQRKILSDPKNLPHRAMIPIGPETADLLVSAIYDSKGNYLGPMVTWEVVTQKLETERQLKEAGERERQATEALKTKVDSILAVVAAAGTGDLTREVTVSGSDAVGQMGEGLGRFFGDLRKNMGAIAQNAQSLASSSEELTAISQQMTSNANETSNQAGVVSSAAEEVSKNTQTVSAGVEELTASIKEIAKNADEAAKVATDAVRMADSTNQTIAKLGESSNEIGNVIKVITSIAQQTNLLALNATIEAARAGEAGKGFAVVANEVKELAKETAKATEDIGRKIEAIQTDTKGAVDAIAQIGTIINRINDIQTTIASAVEEQTATTNEISRNVSETAKGTAEIAQNITGVAQAAVNTSTGSGETQKAASELSRMAAELQQLVGQFKI